VGHDVTAVSRDYPAGIDDQTVLETALREQRVLITADLDFGEMVVRQALPHAGIILMRLPGASLAIKFARLEAVLRDHAGELDRLIVLTEQAVRVR
jgi:predicted nuclease of predicted toxin-antitoxin system